MLEKSIDSSTVFPEPKNINNAEFNTQNTIVANRFIMHCLFVPWTSEKWFSDLPLPVLFLLPHDHPRNVVIKIAVLFWFCGLVIVEIAILHRFWDLVVIEIAI